MRGVRVQTRGVTGRKDGEETKPLEVIDLGSQLGTPTMTSRPRWRGSRFGWAALGLAVAAISVALTVSSGRGSHATRRQADAPTSHSLTTGSATSSSTSRTQKTGPISRPRGPIPGRFYPVVDHADATTMVLPSGLTVRLSGGLTRTIGGLGAAFGGLVTPKDSTVCCALSFGIFHAAPSDLFDTLEASEVSTPLLVSAAHAKLVDLRQFKGKYGILSTGDWTLSATFENLESGVLADATVLKRLGSWRLRSTPYGAVLAVPADSTIDQSQVVLGRNPDLTERQVGLTQNLEPCRTKADTARTIQDGAYSSVGYWCQDALFVRIEGPRPYVESVVADFKVKVKQNA
jgi:hypothetical protein